MLTLRFWTRRRSQRYPGPARTAHHVGTIAIAPCLNITLGLGTSCLVRQSRFFVELVFYACSVFVVTVSGLGLMSPSSDGPLQRVGDRWLGRVECVERALGFGDCHGDQAFGGVAAPGDDGGE